VSQLYLAITSDIHESILIMFSRSQKCFTSPPHLTMLLHYLANCRNTKIAPFNSNAVLMHHQASNSCWLNLFDSVLTCNSSLCINASPGFKQLLA